MRMRYQAVIQFNYNNGLAIGVAIWAMLLQSDILVWHDDVTWCFCYSLFIL